MRSWSPDVAAVARRRKEREGQRTAAAEEEKGRMKEVPWQQKERKQ